MPSWAPLNFGPPEHDTASGASESSCSGRSNQHPTIAIIPLPASRAARASYWRRKPSLPWSTSAAIGGVADGVVGRYTPSTTARPPGAGARYHSCVPPVDVAPAGGATAVNDVGLDSFGNVDPRVAGGATATGSGGADATTGAQAAASRPSAPSKRARPGYGITRGYRRDRGSPGHGGCPG